MADVVAMVADGICHMYMGWCFCPIYNRWNSQLWQLMISMWQMVWPLVWLADVVAMVADGIGHCWKGSMYQGRCYNLVGRCYSQGSYFILSSVVLTRTSSHTWGRWYLPMFLFKDGLSTLIYIDSLINLERPCSSLPTILKLLIVVEWPVMLLWSYIGEGAFRCSLNLSLL